MKLIAQDETHVLLQIGAGRLGHQFQYKLAMQRIDGEWTINMDITGQSARSLRQACARAGGDSATAQQIIDACGRRRGGRRPVFSRRD